MAKNCQPVAMLLRTWLNNKMLCCPINDCHNAVIPDSASTISFNVLDTYRQYEQHIGITTLLNSVILIELQAPNFWPCRLKVLQMYIDVMFDKLDRIIYNWL